MTLDAPARVSNNFDTPTRVLDTTVRRHAVRNGEIRHIKLFQN